MFKSVKLGDLLELLTDYHANGAYKKLKANVELLDEPDYAIMIRTTNFEQNDFKSNLKYINKNAYEFLSKSKVYPKDIIMNKIANAGSSYFMPDLNTKVSLAMNLFLLRANTDLVNPAYLYIYLKINEQYVKSFANGSVTKTITKDAVRNLDIQLPNRKVQDQISKVYYDITGKIELNRQMNETLEAMAQALFKSWFVDFDPVIDNALLADKAIPEPLKERAELRQAQLDSGKAKTNSEINNLFPSEFEFTEELGWIPKGWEVKSFGDVSLCFDKNRVPLSKKQREEKKPGNIPYHGATSVMDYINEWIFDDIYLLIGEDGSVIKEDGSPFVQYIWGKSWVNNHAHVLQGKDDVSTEYLMLFMQAQNLTPYITGAVQLKINQKNMNSIPFLYAEEALNKLFSETITPYYSKLRNSKEENKTLAKLRDTLLPKLMSGELRIADAEKLVADI